MSLEILELDTVRLQHEVILLRRRVAILGSLLRLVVIVLKMSGISFAGVRQFASPTTWYRRVRAHPWRRPRQRVHPAKPKAGTFHPGVTAQLLLEASRSVTSGKPVLLVNGGVENFNSAVDKVIETGLLKRVLAQTKITFSNSLIESWWRVLKHQWLNLNTLDTATTVHKLVAFYIDQHNTQAAFCVSWTNAR